MLSLKVTGGPRLASTMARAEADLDRIPTVDAAKIVAARAQTVAPRRTGRLAGSVRARAGAEGRGTITSPLIYAVPIHWGRPAHNIAANPFISRAATQTEREWMASIEKQGQKICDSVKGA